MKTKIPKIDRIYYPYWDWECYKAGMFARQPPPGLTKEDCTIKYKDFLQNLKLFRENMIKVSIEWPKSCENFLTNEFINRIAWLGQSSMCMYSGIPRHYRVGFCLLSQNEQVAANEEAKSFLIEWIYNEKNKAKSAKLHNRASQMWLWN